MSEDKLPENLKIRFCIPPLRTKIKLAEPWKFNVFQEFRNRDILEILKSKDTFSFSWENGAKVGEITLPTNTLLSVDRIYVRNGAKDFDSVTFRIKKGECPDPKFQGIRFWAKLSDVNKIVCYPIGGKNATPSIISAFMPFATAGERLLDL